MKNDKDLKNLRVLLKSLSNCETEQDFKTKVGDGWTWLILRKMGNIDSTFDDVMPAILEAIEKFFGWGIPTLDEINRMKEERKNTPPDED